MRRTCVAAAAVIAALGMAAGGAHAASDPGPKGGESSKGGSGLKGDLVDTLKGVPPVLGKNGVDNR